MAFIGNQPFGKTVRTITSETLTSVKTQFYPTGGYTVGYVDVYLNGVRLTETSDFTATNGSLVTLLFNPLVDDTVDIVTYGSVELANAVRRDGDTLVGTLYTRALIPTANVTYDIGSATMRYKDLYLSGNTINLGDVSLSTNGTSFSVSNSTGGVFPSALGNTTITGTANVSVGVNVGANVNLSTSIISIGNSTVNSVINSTSIVANGSLLTSINATSISSGTLNTARLAYTPVNKAGDTLGGGSFTKTSSNFTGGNIVFDNGTTDSPGVIFAYGNSVNFGIDAYQGTLRFVRDINESTGLSAASINTSGDFTAARNITSGAPIASAADIGFALNYGSDSNSYGRIRGYTGTGANNDHTIHFFPPGWQSGTTEVSSSGAINLTTVGGVTIGPWNNAHCTFTSTRQRVTLDRYTLYGPNSTWGAYLRVGGNGSINPSWASVVVTNGNLHLDSATGYETYLNWYGGNATNIGNGAATYGTLRYGTLSQGSDYRLKSNISEMPSGALQKIELVNLKQYNLNGYGDRVFYGVIADEVKSLLPHAVEGEKDALDQDGNPKYQTMDYIQLLILTTKALQELKKEFEEYKLSHS